MARPVGLDLVFFSQMLEPPATLLCFRRETSRGAGSRTGLGRSRRPGRASAARGKGARAELPPSRLSRRRAAAAGVRPAHRWSKYPFPLEPKWDIWGAGAEKVVTANNPELRSVPPKRRASGRRWGAESGTVRGELRRRRPRARDPVSSPGNFLAATGFSSGSGCRR